MECEEHLTKDGLIKLVAIGASMNGGLSNELAAAFPNILRAEISAVYISEPTWDPN